MSLIHSVVIKSNVFVITVLFLDNIYLTVQKESEPLDETLDKLIEQTEKYVNKTRAKEHTHQDIISKNSSAIDNNTKNLTEATEPFHKSANKTSKKSKRKRPDKQKQDSVKKPTESEKESDSTIEEIEIEIETFANPVANGSNADDYLSTKKDGHELSPTANEYTFDMTPTEEEPYPFSLEISAGGETESPPTSQHNNPKTVIEKIFINHDTHDKEGPTKPVHISTDIIQSPIGVNKELIDNYNAKELANTKLLFEMQRLMSEILALKTQTKKEQNNHDDNLRSGRPDEKDTSYNFGGQGDQYYKGPIPQTNGMIPNTQPSNIGTYYQMPYSQQTIVPGVPLTSNVPNVMTLRNVLYNNWNLITRSQKLRQIRFLAGLVSKIMSRFVYRPLLNSFVYF